MLTLSALFCGFYKLSGLQKKGYNVAKHNINQKLADEGAYNMMYSV